MIKTGAEDVIAASERISDYVNKTPVVTSRTLREKLCANIYFKCENFQRVGAFKFRGAMNALLKLTEDEKKGGVVAFSSGNHAQAIALASQLLEIPAIILMPNDAPSAKAAATLGYQANVIKFDRYKEDREELGRKIAAEKGCVLIPSYDHPDILAGQGTAAKELIEEVGELDYLFVPLGGGGLLSGSALISKKLSPQCKIIGVEPVNGNDGQRSFRAKSLVHIETPKTIADGAQTQHLGEFTFPLILENVDDIITVSDEELISCMKYLAERMKLVVEPTGCLGFAGALSKRNELIGKKVGVILSGGNVDMDKYANFIASTTSLEI